MEQPLSRTDVFALALLLLAAAVIAMLAVIQPGDSGGDRLNNDVVRQCARIYAISHASTPACDQYLRLLQ